MKFVSWNVNGLRACMNKGFMETFQTLDADILFTRNKNATSSIRVRFTWI